MDVKKHLKIFVFNQISPIFANQTRIYKLLYKKRTDFFSLPSFTHKSKFAIFGFKRTKTPKNRETP